MAAKRKGPIKKEAKGLTESARDTIDVYGMVLESSINDLLEGGARCPGPCHEEGHPCHRR